MLVAPVSLAGDSGVFSCRDYNHDTIKYTYKKHRSQQKKTVDGKDFYGYYLFHDKRTPTIAGRRSPDRQYETADVRGREGCDPGSGGSGGGQARDVGERYLNEGSESDIEEMTAGVGVEPQRRKPCPPAGYKSATPTKTWDARRFSH